MHEKWQVIETFAVKIGVGVQHEAERPGPIALVGSGEYLAVMEETDLALLDRVGGPASARVVVLPTASGLEEPDSPQRWMQLGIDHFARLGARVAAAPILSHADAKDPRWPALLEAADFFYFSGGNPQHLIETMSGSPAWEAILRRHREGAVLAGCSAGAMAICGCTSRFRTLRDEDQPVWVDALGVLPRLIVMPHFDRLAGYIGRDVLDRVVRAVPEGMRLLGIDEDTALVRLASRSEDGSTQWQVMGRQRVSVFETGGVAVASYRPGDTLALHIG